MKALIDGLQAGNQSGTGTYVEALAQHLPGLAPNVHLHFTWPGQVPQPQTADKAVFFPCPVHGPLGRILTSRRSIRHLCTELEPDLIHYPANIAPGRSSTPAVVTIHDVSFFVNPDWFRRDRALYYRFAAARGARMARRIIADSKATASDLEDWLGIPKGRIDVVPLGVDKEFRPASGEEMAAARAKYGLPERFFLFVGTHEPRKNLVRLIEAFGEIARDCPQSLVLAGRAGWKYAPIGRAIEESSDKQRILTPGFIAREDLPAVLSAADALVWPSLYEGFGLPPLEAMACGTPVLTSDASSLPEAVGDAALLVDPFQTASIAGGLIRLAADETLRNQLSAKGRVRAAEFTWKRTADMTLAVYKRAVETDRRE